jgi:predicted fused transcriptional regulator/phosphomethylpyrimidine kinase
MLKKLSPENERTQNDVFNLKGRISLLFYCVKHIQGQFKTRLKLRNKQVAKTIPTVGKNLAVIFF